MYKLDSSSEDINLNPKIVDERESTGFKLKEKSKINLKKSENEIKLNGFLDFKNSSQKQLEQIGSSDSRLADLVPKLEQKVNLKMIFFIFLDEIN